MRSYAETLDYLYTRLPMFSRTGAAALKPGLDNTIRLCAALGDPQAQFKSIHIAGTNGKGSTSHMLAAIFRKAGYKTGLYTSPHLVDFRERIRIDGKMITREFVTDFVEKAEPLIEAISPSFFEITVAMAFAAFALEGVDIAIIETGLGGRLDSTNIITPELSIITNISLDHTDLLGDTRAKIAAEKAGIIKPGIPVVIGEKEEETVSVFLAKAKQESAPISFAEDDWQAEIKPEETARGNTQRIIASSKSGPGKVLDLTLDLPGIYQRENVRTVLAACDVLINAGWKISDAIIGEALQNAATITGLRGRYETLAASPLVIADVAHNAAGLKQVLAQWAREGAERKHIILGFVRDKDVRAALELFPRDAAYYFTNAAIPRALPAKDLQALATECGLAGAYYARTEEAVDAALKSAGQKDAILITGSFFIVGEALGHSEFRISNSELRM